MHITRKRSIAALVATVALVAAGTGAAIGAPQDDGKVRKTDFIPGLSDTRDTGAFGFADDGSLVIRTAGSASTDKVAEYFPLTGGLPDTASVDWSGSNPEPGVQIVFDADSTAGNGNDFNILVGEKIYGDDFWLSNGSSQTAKDAAPSHEGGSGSANHGTLAQWQAALPNAKMSAAGFSLGSGVKGDGVLKAVVIDGTNYTFEDDPAAATPPPAVTPEAHTSTTKPTGSIVWANRNRVGKVTMKTNALPANNRGAGKITWTIKVAGATRFTGSQGFGQTQTYAVTFGKAGGSKKVEVFRNGALYSTRYVTTK